MKLSMTSDEEDGSADHRGQKGRTRNKCFRINS